MGMKMAECNLALVWILRTEFLRVSEGVLRTRIFEIWFVDMHYLQ